MTFGQLMEEIEKDTVLSSPSTFEWLAGRMDYPTNIKAGKYEINRNMNLVSILRMLKNGHQVPVHFTILKLRTQEGLSSMIARKFEPDSVSVYQFLTSNDSLKAFGVDTNTYMTIILPNTYTLFWNTTPTAIFRKIYANYKNWWTDDRSKRPKRWD